MSVINTKVHRYVYNKCKNCHVTCYKYQQHVSVISTTVCTFNCEILYSFKEINAKITGLNVIHITAFFH